TSTKQNSRSPSGPRASMTAAGRGSCRVPLMWAKPTGCPLTACAEGGDGSPAPWRQVAALPSRSNGGMGVPFSCDGVGADGHRADGQDRAADDDGSGDRGDRTEHPDSDP